MKLRSLLGRMSFASKVIVPGRIFMSYLLNFTREINNNHDVDDLYTDCEQDMKMWLKLLENWNGVSFFLSTL